VALEADLQRKEEELDRVTGQAGKVGQVKSPRCV